MTTEAQITRTEEIEITCDPPPREPMTLARVRELFEDAQYAPWGYEGRGMRGEKCLAVTTDSASESVTVILDVIQACAENGDAEDVSELVNLLRGSRSDSFGRSSVVVYWPDSAWADCGGDGTDEDEGCGTEPDNGDEYLDSVRGGSRGDREDFHSDG